MQITVREISNRLAERVEEVCKFLLPGGKNVRGQWVAGDITGSSGKSLHVHLSGDHVGHFKDFASQDDKGDLIDLWRITKGITAAEAVKEVKEWLGIHDPVEARADRGYGKPPKEIAGPASAERVQQWFKEKRSIDAAIVNRFRIEGSVEKKAIAFPCYNPAGGLINRSYRTLGQKKEVWQEKGCAPALFGWQALSDIAYQESTVILCEGQIDAMTWTQWGFPALSVPNGSGLTWIEYEWDNLQVFDRIYLSFDMDGAGSEIVERVMNRLGRHRCLLVSLPKKDANDCLIAGYAAKDAERWILEAKAPGVKGLVIASDLEQRVLRDMEPKKLCFTLPFFRGTDPHGFDGFYPRPGEVTLWSGTTFHGKALAIDTPIPTPSGWTMMGDLKIGDTVYHESGQSTRVIWCSEVMHDRPCIELLFSDGSKVVCDELHQWKTRSPAARASAKLAKKRMGMVIKEHGSNQTHKMIRSRVVAAGEIANTLLDDRPCTAGRYKHAVLACSAIEGQAGILLVHPYVLGAWLGDGHAAGGRITSADQDIIDAIRRTGFIVTQTSKSITYGVKGLQVLLRKLGVLNNKHIPRQYLRASIEQRKALLAGLMDTDGYIHNTHGQCEYTTIDQVLASDVYELIVSLGIKARLSEGRATLYGKDCGAKYRIIFYPSDNVFVLRRKSERFIPTTTEKRKSRYIISAKYVESVPVKCIQIDKQDGMFLCGRSMIPTHNSTFLNYFSVALLGTDHNVFMASLEMTVESLVRRMIYAYYQHEPTPDEIRTFIKRYGANLVFADKVGYIAQDELMEMMRYAYQRYGVSHVIVDSLMRISKLEEDYVAQGEFLNILQEFAKTTKTHVHLVAHPRKKSEEYRLNNLDIKGSSLIPDNADNIVFVMRNTAKDRLRAEGNLTPDQSALMHDTEISVDKQRETGWIGSYYLNFDPRYYSYSVAKRAQ